MYFNNDNLFQTNHTLTHYILYYIYLNTGPINKYVVSKSFLLLFILFFLAFIIYSPEFLSLSNSYITSIGPRRLGDHLIK